MTVSNKGIKLMARTFLNQGNDWHKPLVSNLDEARRHVQSKEIKAAIEKLAELLAANDECVHTVVVTAAVPLGVDVQVVEQSLMEDQLDVPNSVEFAAGNVTVTTTLRGSVHFAQETAESNLRYALRESINQSPNKQASEDIDAISSDQ